MLQMPGVSLACADFAFAAICRWQRRSIVFYIELPKISKYCNMHNAAGMNWLGGGPITCAF